MAQVKLFSIAFVLAAAAIAPIIAHPMPQYGHGVHGSTPQYGQSHGNGVHASGSMPQYGMSHQPHSSMPQQGASYQPHGSTPQYGHGPPRRGFGTREYAEFDIFERDFEDIEFDARDFDDELYLD